MKKFQKNNKGYSLIELLVVVALIIVAASGIAVSFAVIFSNNVRACATDMGSFVSMGKVNSNYRSKYVYIEYTIVGSNIVARYYEGATLKPPPDTDGLGTMLNEKVMGSSSIVRTLAGFPNGAVDFTNAAPLRIAFERGTSVMMQIVPDGTGWELREFTDPKPTITLGTPGTGSAYIVELYPYTGGHEIKKG